MVPRSECPGSGLPRGRRRPHLLLLLLAAAALAALVVISVPALAAEPTLTVDPVAVHTITTAKASGTITTDSEADGGAETFYFFQYTEAGKAEWTNGPQAFTRTVPAETTTPLTVEEELTDLKAATSYEVRLAAFPVTGGETFSAPSTPFTTSPAPNAPTLVLDPATAVGATTATISGTVDPEGGNLDGPGEPVPISWTLETNHEGEGFSAAATGTIEGAPAEESNPIAVEAESEGLAPGNNYAYRLRADYAGQEVISSEGNFTTEAAPPTITGTTSTAIGGTEATLVAQVNPGGAETTYHFEYGTDEGYGHATPTGTITTELNSADTVEAHVEGLEAGAGYHFRLVASNSAAPAGVDGQDTTFMAVTAPAAGLPDGRVYERVSPVEDQSADVYYPYGVASPNAVGVSPIRTLLPFQAADDGNAIAYVGDPTVGGNGKSGLGLGDQYLATRLPGGGWSQTTITPSGNETGFYEAFSPDLSLGVIQSGGPESPEIAPLSSDGPAPGWKALYSHRFDEASYSALFTASATPQNRESGEFGTAGVPRITSQVGSPKLDFAGASADQRRLLFEANAALTPSAPDGSAEENNLYLSEAGTLSLVNVLPGGSTEAGATFGAAAAGRTEGNDPDYSHVISADGERVYWTDVNGEGPDNGHIYLREDPTAEESTVGCEEGKACTIAVSAGEARYWTATPDGLYAYYTEDEELWRFDAATGEREAIAGPGVQAVIGINEAKEESEDGGYVYFISRSDLSGPERDSQGHLAQEGEENVFVLHGTAAPRLVATLSSRDAEEALGEALNKSPNRQIGDVQPGLGNRTAEVSADGTGLVFMSDAQSVEGFMPAYEGDPLEEVYSYSYADNHLSCASCNSSHEPTAAPPSQIAEELTAERVGAMLPPDYSLTHLPQWLSSDGSRVFFDSFEPLLPADTDNLPDVYEWERDGTGSCTRTVGCLFLISSGTSRSGGGWLIDASASGNDVFFVSRSELVSGSESENEAFALYDARVGGVAPSMPPACSGAECKAEPSAAPSSRSAGSESFAGAGNPQSVNCKKGTIRKHGKCVKRKAQKHKQHHKEHHRHHQHHGQKQRAGSESGGRK